MSSIITFQIYRKAYDLTIILNFMHVLKVKRYANNKLMPCLKDFMVILQ